MTITQTKYHGFYGLRQSKMKNHFSLLSGAAGARRTGQDRQSPLPDYL
jgi:hypothetical protein